ncbi:MAG TPA: glycosyltransferase [Candidatus Paceibacterota bacterium]
MYNIVIGIPTYKRPLMLKKLILSITDCNINKSLIKDINIIVVDNDIDKTAEKIVKELIDRFYGIHKLNYYNYPVKGLSNVRNELFNKALEFNPDYIVCIDDDEYPASDWLNQLLLTTTILKADITQGPVIPVFENEVSPYISNWFKYQKIKNHKRVKFFWTSNFIISVSFLLKHKIKFDERFNITGSEDSYFGVTALKKGAKIFWASNAIIYETIPAKRAKLKWLIKRSYNGAINFTYILKLEKIYFGLLKKTIISIAYFIIGGISLVVIPFPFRWKYWGVLKMSESIGNFAGLFGIQFHEYAKDR